jgi:hypothetical protein
MKIVEVPRERALPEVLRRVAQTDVVLDVGPGIQPQSYFRPRTHICVEAHAPYVERLRADRAGDPGVVCLRGTWQQVLPHLPDDSVDTAFALDLIEHLEKEDGFALLREMSRIARVQVVIFTPLGMYPQEYGEGDADAWGMDGGHWQTHRSGWFPAELARVGEGWEAVVVPGFHHADQHGQPLEKPFGAFWAIRTVGAAPADAKTAWEAQRVKHAADRSRAQAGRLARFARSPLATSARVIRRLTGGSGA